jgi:glycosyltransferase involved in cell wall biosynthesis
VKVSLLTCTGGRPEAFALCEKWMERQSLDWHEWIVVDDCDPPTETTLRQVRVEPEPKWSGETTLGRNMLAGLERVTGDAVAFIEDDDWYDPDYLKTAGRLLERSPLVGEGLARYYNVRTRRWNNRCNAGHACLAATLCRADEIPRIVSVVNILGKPCYDLSIWRAFDDCMLMLHPNNFVGIKGMPGRAGIAHGHTDGACNHPDPEMEKLREWIGPDALFYEHFSD